MSTPLDSKYELHAPEALVFRGSLAGPVRRLLAWTVDLVVRILLILILYLAAIPFGLNGLDGFSTGILLLGYFVLDWGYFFFMEIYTGGRSLGKMASKLRVIRSDGLPVTWRESLLRNFLRVADLSIVPPAIILLGPIFMIFDPKFRRIGDLVAGTMVVVDQDTKLPSKSAQEKSQNYRFPKDLRLSHEDYAALELFAHRKNISEERREELAQIIAPEYAKHLAMEEPHRPAEFLDALWDHSQELDGERA